MKITINEQYNQEELRSLFERAFSEILQDETGYFTEHPEKSQNSLAEWFDFDAMIAYLPQSALIQAFEDDNKLVGAACIGKQHPISWPDGHKAELFIIGILPESSHKGLGTKILAVCEQEAKKMGAETVVINAHSEQPQLHKFYEKNNYVRMGVLKNYYDNGDAIFFSKKLN